MPSLEKDPRFNNKKRHIGNDYVTIVYNDSSEDYLSGTISVSSFYYEFERTKKCLYQKNKEQT